MKTEINVVMEVWENITVDDYGMTGILELEQNGVAVDISLYTTLEYVLQKPSGTSVTVTAAFNTDGEDGKLKYAFVDGDIDEFGVWEVQARISKTGTQLTSESVKFVVNERLD